MSARGCLLRQGVCPRGVCPGVSPGGGGCLPRGCFDWGVLAGGGCLPAKEGVHLICPVGGVSGRHTPIWTEFLTHACENITFLQLRLRMVIIDQHLPYWNGN